MPDLAEFLLARIADDEAIVAILRQHPNWEADGDDVCDQPDYVIAHVRGDYAARHIARWDPARVLAECAAKRQVVSLCQRLERKSLNDNLWNIDEDDEILAALALPYADHPDYDQSWRP